MAVVAFIGIGLVAGALAASLGIGGGVVYVPALVSLFAFGQHDAQGTSLAVIIPTAIVAAVVHSRAGRVVWPVAIPLGIGGIIGGFLGGTTAQILSAPVLRRLFAVFLVISAFRMLAKTRRRSHETPAT
ncbi:MAG TPA: sulfite exporter TauE/SafE family protein [Acidimicrobiia bacterium]|nr:sulfite exporter TauE/SafE family protein [Acidimicrobiia bacterium]